MKTILHAAMAALVTTGLFLAVANWLSWPILQLFPASEFACSDAIAAIGICLVACALFCGLGAFEWGKLKKAAIAVTMPLLLSVAAVNASNGSDWCIWLVATGASLISCGLLGLRGAKRDQAMWFWIALSTAAVLLAVAFYVYYPWPPVLYSPT